MTDMIEFSPEDIPDITVEELLDSLTLGVMRDSISQQIQGIIPSQQNFLSIVTEKFTIIDNNVVDPDIKREVSYEMVDFCRSLVLEIVDLYGLCYQDDHGESKRIIDILNVLYNFFILRAEEFIGNFLIRYIEKNKEQLLQDVVVYASDAPTIESVTTKSNEKKSISKDNIWLLSHMDSVINYIASLQIDPIEFLEIINDGDYYIEQLISYYEEDLLMGDFSAQYIKRFVDEYESERSTEIRNTVRLAFIQ